LPEPELQYQLGWSIIGVTVFNIIVNMLVMFYATFKQLSLVYRRLKAHYEQWKGGKA